MTRVCRAFNALTSVVASLRYKLLECISQMKGSTPEDTATPLLALSLDFSYKGLVLLVKQI